MAVIAKKHRDELDSIKYEIKKAYDWFMPNYKRWHGMRKFFLETSLTEDDKNLLRELGKPEIEYNTSEAYVSRLLGEFSKQEPSFVVHGEDGKVVNPAVISVTEGHMRFILSEANNESFEYEVYKDCLTGGFSVAKVWTDYQNEMSLDQVIKNGRCYDPTLCGFDPVARQSHKGDGRFSFEIYPKTVDEFEEEFDKVDLDGIKFTRSVEGFNWSYRSQKEDIILVADFYKKIPKKTKIVQLMTGHVLPESDYEKFLERWNKSGFIAQPPAVKKSRITTINSIRRYVLIENQILDTEETDYRYLPHVFFDGNSVMIRDNNQGDYRQLTKPYLYNAIGAQRLRNFSVQTLANELENMVQHKIKVPIEAIPEQYVDAYTDVQRAKVLAYKQFLDNDPDKRLDPPQEIMRVPTPPEVMGTVQLGDQMFQAILGSYDASLGINDNQLSGVAIVEGATQSNSAAMPFIKGFLQGLNQMAQINLDLIPKYLVDARNIPIIGKDNKRSYAPINQPGGIDLMNQPVRLQVRVEAGVNFAIQKTRALQQIIALMQASPIFGQFINQEGLEILLDNLEIRGVDQLKDMAAKFMQQLKQMQAKQQGMPNPEMMKIQIEGAKLQQKAQQDQADNQFRAAEIANSAQSNQNEAEKLELQKMQLASKIHGERDKNAIQREKARTERFGKAVDLALKTGENMHNREIERADMTHRHTKEAIELAHNIAMDKQQMQQSEQE